MSAHRSNRSLLLIAGGLLVFGGGVFVLLSDSGARDAPDPVRPVVQAGETAPARDTSSDLIPVPRPVRYEQTELASTTVLWPLRVELDLVRASYLPSEDGMAPIGSGASARIAGVVHGPDDGGTRATVRFVAGPNQGRELRTDVTGAFGATDLFPGLSIVEIKGPGLIGSRREVRLRQNNETLLNVTYADPGKMAATVQDREGNPVDGASIRVDGVRTETGPDGVFFVGAIASGQVLVEIEHPDFAAYQELVWVAAGQMAPGNSLTFTLDKGASLNVVVTNNVGGPGPVQLYLLPGQFTRQSSGADSWRNMRFPYHARNPIEVQPGRPHLITGLRAETVQVLAFRAGASTTMKFANVRAGRPYDLKIEMRPAPKITGHVKRDGQPVAGATVVLEAPNKVRATLSYLREGNHYLETAVMPNFPPARQEVETDANGRFVLTAWEDESPTRYLEARGPTGTTWTGRLVHRGDYVVDLELEDARLGDSDLVLAFPDRFQGLPLEVLIEGQPLDPWILPPNEDLRLTDLLSGEWRVKITWNSDPVFEGDLTLAGETERTIVLPVECLEGQDPEAWRRAGREYPSS